MLTTGSKPYSNPQIVLRNIVGPRCGNPRNNNNKWLMIIIGVIVVLSFIIYSLSHAAGERIMKSHYYSPESRTTLWIAQYTKQYLSKDQHWIDVSTAIQHIESDMCINKVGDLDPSFGCGGMKVSAVIDAAKFWKIIIPQTHDRIIWKLIRNDKFAIQMSIAYLGYLYKVFNDREISIIAYNIGPTKTQELLICNEALPRGYYNKVQKQILDSKI